MCMAKQDNSVILLEQRKAVLPVVLLPFTLQKDIPSGLQTGPRLNDLNFAYPEYLKIVFKAYKTIFRLCLVC